MRNIFSYFVIGVLLAGTSMPRPLRAADAPKTARPRIYDESADGSQQIADAVAIAKKENKRVLVQFGANWCGWCHLLHKLFETDKIIAATLKANYVIVRVDANEGHNT